LESDSKTGLLHIKNEEKVVGLFLKEGSIAYATCSQADTRLGYLLRSSGVISNEELETHLAKAKETNQALGKILVDKNVITNETLSEFIQKQAENIIYDLFFWKAGRYEYKDIEIDPERVFLKKISVMNVLLEASRRIDEMQMIRELIPDDTLIFGKAEATENVVDDLNEQESLILTFVDGKCSIRQIIEKSGVDEYSVFNALNSLILSGCIQPCEESFQQNDVEVEVAPHDRPTLENLKLETDGDSEEPEKAIPEKPDQSGDAEDDVPEEDVAAEAPQESEKVVDIFEESPPVMGEEKKQDSFFSSVVALFSKEKRFIVVCVSTICLFLIVEALIFVFGPNYLEDKRMEDEYQNLLIRAENKRNLEEREKMLVNFLKSNKKNIHSRDIGQKIKEIRKSIIKRDFESAADKADKLSRDGNYAEARDVYHLYLDQYPKTVYSKEIKKKLTEVNHLLEADDYKKIGDIAPEDYEARIIAYDAYLEDHPEGKNKEAVISLLSDALKGYCTFLKGETRAGKTVSINGVIFEKHKEQIVSMSADLMLPDDKRQVKELMMKGNQELKKGHYEEAAKYYRQSLAVVRGSRLSDFPAYRSYESKILTALNVEKLKCYKEGLVPFKGKCYTVQEYEEIIQEHGYVKDGGTWYAPDEYEAMMLSRGFYKYNDEYLNQARFEKEVLATVLKKECELEDWQRIDTIDVKLTKSSDDEIDYEISGVANANLEDYRVVVHMSLEATFNRKNDQWRFFNPQKDSSLKQYE
jgi:hypothetical protein